MYSLNQIVELIPRFTLGIITILPFLMLWILSFLLFKSLKKKIQYQNPLIAFFSKLTNISIITIAIMTLLGTMGVDISALLTGLGLTGFALGFALKDVLSSCIAGILILFYRPFKLQSKITVMGVEGTVIDIDLRYTTLKNGSEKHLIPNSKLISEKITIIEDK
tara:strand:+ start:837 stop:1328 length:492 start_codon:yes stop_codon:yes gene_type:complete